MFKNNYIPPETEIESKYIKERLETKIISAINEESLSLSQVRGLFSNILEKIETENIVNL